MALRVDLCPRYACAGPHRCRSFGAVGSTPSRRTTFRLDQNCSAVCGSADMPAGRLVDSEAYCIRCADDVTIDVWSHTAMWVDPWRYRVFPRGAKSSSRTTFNGTWASWWCLCFLCTCCCSPPSQCRGANSQHTRFFSRWHIVWPHVAIPRGHIHISLAFLVSSCCRHASLFLRVACIILRPLTPLCCLQSCSVVYSRALLSLRTHVFAVCLSVQVSRVSSSVLVSCAHTVRVWARIWEVFAHSGTGPWFPLFSSSCMHAVFMFLFSFIAVVELVCFHCH